MKAKFQKFFHTYGWVGLGVWYVIFLLTVTTVAGLVHLGVPLERLGETVATGGPWVAGYAVAKLLMAPRLALTLAITPFVARVVRRPPAEASG